MRKILLSAAAVLLSTSYALATQHVISFDGWCDTFTTTTQNSTKVLSMVSSGTGCDDGFGIGGSAKMNDLGGLNFTTVGYSVSGSDYIFSLQLQQPLRTGHAWYASYSSDGVNFTLLHSGTYTVDSPGKHSGPPAIAGR
jgi:hypothetical protein